MLHPPEELQYSLTVLEVHFREQKRMCEMCGSEQSKTVGRKHEGQHQAASGKCEYWFD